MSITRYLKSYFLIQTFPSQSLPIRNASSTFSLIVLFDIYLYAYKNLQWH